MLQECCNFTMHIFILDVIIIIIIIRDNYYCYYTSQVI